MIRTLLRIAALCVLAVPALMAPAGAQGLPVLNSVTKAPIAPAQVAPFVVLGCTAASASNSNPGLVRPNADGSCPSGSVTQFGGGGSGGGGPVAPTAAGTSATTANPIQGVTGGVPMPTTTGRLAYVAQGTLLVTPTVATTSTLLANAAVAAQRLTICTDAGSTANVWLNPTGAAAVAHQGAPVFAGGGCYVFAPAPTAAVYGISDGGGSVTINAQGG